MSWRSAPTHSIVTFAIAALLLCVVASACAPLSQSLGPPLEQPQLRDEYALMADGTRLPMRMWLPDAEAPTAILLALHGFNDYSNAFAAPAAFWATQSIAVVAYDQRGFGATAQPGIWPGTEALISDLRSVTGLVRARYPDRPLYLLGESMGGAVILTAAAEGPLDADGVILVAPAVRGRATMNPFYRAVLWLGAHLFPSAEATGRGLGIVASDNVEMIRALRKDPLVIKRTRIDAVWGLVDLMDSALDGAPTLQGPALLAYGVKDELIPKEPTRALLSRFDGNTPRLAVYESGYHMLLRDLQAEVPLRDIARWIKTPGAPLESGAETEANAFFGLDVERTATKDRSTVRDY
jgi:alpha-beta hydrolase superfamily lysophospholipase